MAATWAQPDVDVQAFTGKRRAVLFGCNEYADEGLPTLRCARADVEAVAEVLSDQTRGRFETTILPPDVTFTDVLTGMQSVLGDLGGGDTFLLYFSGHAFKDANGRLALALAGTDQRVDVTGVPLANLITAIDNSQAQKIILVFDCCFSGAIQESFSQLRQVKDLWVIAAATAAQQAYEKEGSQNSIMTGFFLDGLRSGFADLDNTGDISVSEAYAYTQRLVRTAFAESGPKPPRQEPTIFIPTGSRGEVALALNPRRFEVNLANIDKQYLKLFAATAGMVQLVREAQPYRFKVVTFKYYIEGVPVRSVMLTVAPDYTPNMIVTEQGFDCDAFFPPHLLNDQILEGRQVVEGRVRVRMHVPYEEISMIIVDREQDLEAGDDEAVTLFSRTGG